MKAAVKKAWVAALRSGKYKQGRGKLRTADNKFCCLGVLCNLHAQAHPQFAATQTNPTSYDNAEAFPSRRVMEWAGMSEYANDVVTIKGMQSCLPGHNDGHPAFKLKRRTFKQIADAIEAQL